MYTVLPDFFDTNFRFLLLLRKWLNVWFYYLAVHDKECADLLDKLLGSIKEKRPDVATDLMSLVERLKTVYIFLKKAS